MLLSSAAFLATWIPRIEINAETDAFIAEDDPGLGTYYETRVDWGWDEYATVCVTSDEWFSPAGIERLGAMEEEFLAIPSVTSVMSVMDVPLLRQLPDVKPKLLELQQDASSLREPDVDLGAARLELLDHELAKGNLISEDGRSLNLLVYLSFQMVDGKVEKDVIEQRREMVAGVREVIARWQPQLAEPVRISGIPVINITMFENIRHDLIVFGIASLAIFTLAFALVYRNWRFVVMPMLSCLLPAVGMLGALAYMGIPVALVTSNMPVLLFVLMLPYNVYFIERYRERRVLYPTEPSSESTLQSLKTIFIPCLFSCATTVAGFAALSTSRIIPIRDFGKMMTIGMLVGFCSVFLFIPAFSALLKGIRIKRRRPSGDLAEGGESAGRRRSRGLVRVLERSALRHPVAVLVASAVVLLLSTEGVRRLSAESKITSYFWPGSEVYQGLEFIDQNLGGTTWIEVILSSEEEGYFGRREGLEAIQLAEAYFESLPETGNVLSLTKVRDEMRKTLRRDWFPILPDSLLLKLSRIASPELIGQTANADFTVGRSTIRMKETAPTLNRKQILDGLQRHLDAHPDVFGELDVQITGIFPVYSQILETLLEGQKWSAVVVPLAVYLMLIVLFRSPVLALIVLIPQALPATVLLGVMGWTGIPLDLVTVMIASIAVGVGIDAAIQYTMRLRSELEATGGDIREAVRRAHATVGRAIWIATSIIVAGFAILVLSEFFPSVWFGLFTALAMLISQLATLSVLPSLFLLTGYPRTTSGGRSSESGTDIASATSDA
ncbi:MAG: efflux RND transporter permease subunit [Verrucomicrobiales bacterium]